MEHEKYEDVKSSSDHQEFKFLSVGHNGSLTKLVQFKQFEHGEEIYNLSLGTILDKGNIDFETLSKNGDRNKILATIVACANSFSDRYPERKIFLKGDVPAKTRLYQMTINHAYEALTEKYFIFGLTINKVSKTYSASNFIPGENYDAFLFVRRIVEVG